MEIVSPVNEKLWRAGLTLEEYLESMTENRSRMRRRMQWIRMTPYERALFARMERPVRALVLAEDDCLDCLMNIPLLAHIQVLAKPFEVRLFRRSQQLLLSAYLDSRGADELPVFLFVDGDFHEIGLWSGRPRTADARLADWRKQNPEYDAIQARDDLPAEEKQALLGPLKARLLEEMEDWYDLGLQLDASRELREVLKGWIPES